MKPNETGELAVGLDVRLRVLERDITKLSIRLQHHGDTLDHIARGLQTTLDRLVAEVYDKDGLRARLDRLEAREGRVQAAIVVAIVVALPGLVGMMLQLIKAVQ